MTEREKFEKVFPVPEGTQWDEENSDYCMVLPVHLCIAEVSEKARAGVIYGAMFDAFNVAWQAAKADSAAQAEALQQQRRVLSGQLENCIRHLHAASRHGRKEFFNEAIESANAAMTATEPKP